MPAAVRKRPRMDDILTNGHVVENFRIGNTRISICDDYCVKTQEEIDEILHRVARIAMDAFAAAATRENT